MASKLVIVAVLILDVIAFGLAVAAEQRRSTVCFSLCFYVSHIIGDKQSDFMMNSFVSVFHRLHEFCSDTEI